MICPNIKNEQVVREFNEIVEALGGTALTADEFKSSDLRSLRSGVDYSAMEATYKIWHLNNGNAIDLAPNGALSKLFIDLLNAFNGNRSKAIVAKSKVYSLSFRNWFGDWVTVNNFNVDDIDTSVVDVEEVDKSWRDDASKSNKTLRIYIKNQHEKGYFELVKDQEFGIYSVHFKTATGVGRYDNPNAIPSTKEDRKTLFKELIKAIPDGALVSTWGSLSDDGIKGLNNVGRNMKQVGTRSATKKSDGSSVSIPIFQKGDGVSKVVDENGEPLVVYRGTRPDSTVHTTGIFRSNIIFTTPNKTGASRYGEPLGLFVNAKNPAIIDYKGAEYDKRIEDEFYTPGKGFTSLDRKVETAINKGYDGLIVKNVKDGTNYPIDDYAVMDPNRIKSATDNNGDFSRTRNEINALAAPPIQFTNGSLEYIFGDLISQQLYNNGDVTSDVLIEHLMYDNSISTSQSTLANILYGHKIPVLIDKNMTPNKIAETLTDENGDSVIVINPDVMRTVTRQYAITTILHEVVHATTVTAITKPQSKSDLAFARLNSKVFRSFKKLLPNNIALLSNTDSGLYAFSNEKEFAAVYITDDNVRRIVRQIARDADLNNNGKFTLRLKQFVNSIVKLFSSKSVFKSNIERLNQYEENFEKYLNDKLPITVSETSNMSDLIKQYKSIDKSLLFNESVIDFFNNVEKSKNAILSNALMISPFLRRSNDTDSKNALYEIISSMLHTRLKSLRSSSKQDIKDKDRLILQTAGQIEMFTNDFVSKYSAIASLVSESGSQIYADIANLRSRYNNNIDISGEEYMYHAHANFGMFELLSSTLITILNSDSNVNDMIDFYNQDKNDDEKINMDDILSLKDQVGLLNSMCVEANAVLNATLNRITAKKLLQVRNEVGALDLDDTINRILNQNLVLDSDISLFELWAGASDASSSSVIRAIAHILGLAKDIAETESLRSLDKLIKLSKGLNLSELYEKSGKNFTGYLIRKLNYGKFFLDYDAAMRNINEKISKKYNIKLKPENRIAPSDNEQARQEWHKLRNAWLNDHCERRYVNGYYEAWNKVPEIAKLAIASYNSEISTIMQKPQYLVDGRVAYEKISDDDWNKLLHLWVLKKLLRSEYTINGFKKQVGTEEYDIMTALKQLDVDLEKLNPNKKQLKTRDEEWLNARNAIIEECGGREAYDKYLRGEENHGFDVKKLEKWDSRNTIRTLKRDKNTGEILVFKKIEELMRGNKPDYGLEYEEIGNQIRELLKPFRDFESDVIAKEVPKSVQNLIQTLQQKRSEIRKQRISRDPLLSKLSEQYGKFFDQYLKQVDTKYYKEIQEEIRDSLMNDEDFDPGFFMEDEMFLLSDYGYGQYLDGELIGVTPYSWLTRLEATDEQYMDVRPGTAWVDSDFNEQHINHTYELLSKEEGNLNMSMIPKKQYYENKEYDKLMSNEEYRKTHQEVLRLMTKANEKQTNRQFCDNYLLPQITGTLYQRMKLANGLFGWFNLLLMWTKEKFGYKYNPDDDAELGTTFAADASLNTMDLIFDKHTNSLNGRYPDGRPFNIIPQYYTSRLEDPSMISSDLINILYQYYLMSASYEQKSKVRDELDSLLDLLNQRQFQLSETTTSGGKNQEESRTYKSAKKFLEMNLYNIKRSDYTINLFGRLKKITYTKSLSLWKEYATARNLGANPKVALTGMFCSTYVHTINAILGTLPGVHDKYNIQTATNAFIEVLMRGGIKNIAGLRYAGNMDSNDKLMKIMEFCDLTNQASRKFKYSDRNRGFGVISKNYVYGFMTLTDFFIKSQIATTEFMNYVYVDGEFVTKSDIYYNRHELGEENFHKKLNAFKEALKSGKYSLYSLLKVKPVNENGVITNKLTVDDLYKQAWDKVKFIAKNRAVKTAENADGMATQLQRNALSQSILGALVLMHRQYLPLMLQETFGKTVYDYDTQRYKNGQFRILFQMVSDLTNENLLAASAVGGLVSYGLGGFIGTAAYESFIAYKALKKLWKKMKGSYLARPGHSQYNGFFDFINKNFNDFSSTESTHKSYTNRNLVAKTVVEILLFNLVVNPIINYVCKAYDDDDRWWVLFLLYVLRATQWEAYTKYRTVELFNNIKSATAATSVTDGILELAQGINMLINPRNASENLFGILSEAASNANNEVQKGPYQGLPKFLKSGAKLTPWHNTWEQYKDPKAKRKYNETQIQKLPKENR